MATTEEVLNHHLSAFGKGDLDDLLSDYTDSSVLLSAQGTFRGLEQLRNFFGALITEFGKPGMTFDMDFQIADGETALIAWSAETEDNVYAYATDTFIVRDGKIVAQTFAAKIKPKPPM